MKNKNVTVNIKSELITDLKNFAQQVCIGAATTVRDVLYNTTVEAFERFYCHYAPIEGGFSSNYIWKFSAPSGHPIEYIRTFNVLENDVINKYYENKHGKIIRGGVQLLPNNMKERYNISAAEVFANISSGYHGLPTPYNNIPDMKPSPERIVNNKLDEIVDNVNSICYAPGLERALKKNYTYLQT